MAGRLLFRSLKTVPKTHKASTALAYTPLEAIALAKAYAIAPFDETMEVAVNLAINTKKTDQLVRGSCFLPSGLGKQTKLAVFTSETYAEQALKAGADFAGNALLENVEKGIIEFDKVLATSEIVPQLKRFGKALGPKGLMPSAKVGTVIEVFDLDTAIKRAKQGQVTFRVEENGVLHAPIGKASFLPDALLKNYIVLFQEINKLRPASLKGKYIHNAYLKTTHGPAWLLVTEAVDARSRGSIL